MGIFGQNKKIILTKYENLNSSEFPFKVNLLGVQKLPEKKDEYKLNVKVENTSSLDLETIMIGFEFVSKFKDYHDHKFGYGTKIIPQNKSDNISWSFYIPEGSIVGYIVAFPYKARFVDESIWNVDLKNISIRINEMYNLDIDILKEEEKNKR